MLLARVVGNVVATQKNAKLEGTKLLLVQPEDVNGARRCWPSTPWTRARATGCC
jgi:microcompartment protein CcmK/EutM